MSHTRVLPARMTHAVHGRIPAGCLPTIPTWWPVPPADDGTVPPTEDERARVRLLHARDEAAAGPVDGAVFKVVVVDGRPPALFHPAGAPGVTYRLDRERSTSSALVYRYDPAASPMHPQLMRAVEAAFDEMGREYTIAAREDDTDAHDAPRTGIRYQGV